MFLICRFNVRRRFKLGHLHSKHSRLSLERKCPPQKPFFNCTRGDCEQPPSFSSEIIYRNRSYSAGSPRVLLIRLSQQLERAEKRDDSSELRDAKRNKIICCSGLFGNSYPDQAITSGPHCNPSNC